MLILHPKRLVLCILFDEPYRQRHSRFIQLFELLAALDTFGVRLRVRHKAVHELILARDAHPGQHHPALDGVRRLQKMMHRYHPLHRRQRLVHRDALVEGRDDLGPLPAGLDVAGREELYGVEAVFPHQGVVKLRLDLAVAHTALPDIGLHIRVTGAVQREVADKAQHISQCGAFIYCIFHHGAGAGEKQPRPSARAWRCPDGSPGSTAGPCNKTSGPARGDLCRKAPGAVPASRADRPAAGPEHPRQKRRCA